MATIDFIEFYQSKQWLVSINLSDFVQCRLLARSRKYSAQDALVGWRINGQAAAKLAIWSVSQTVNDITLINA